MSKAGRPAGSKKDGLKYLSEDQLKRFFTAVRKRKRLRDDLIFTAIFYFGLRVARHLAAVKALLSSLNELDPKKRIEINQMPSFSQVRQKGIGHFLKPQNRS